MLVMSSGNFIIGEDLSLEGFNTYVKPRLEEYKTEVKDYLVFKDHSHSRVLVSLLGKEGILERIVKISLDEAHKILEKEDKEKGDSRYNKIAWPREIKNYQNGKLQEIYKVIGVYQNDETASKIFQSLAVEYSAKNINSILSEATRQIRYFGEKLKNF